MTDIEKLKARIEEFEYIWGDDFSVGFRHAIEVLEEVETPEPPNPIRKYIKGVRVYPCEPCKGRGTDVWGGDCDTCKGKKFHLPAPGTAELEPVTGES